MENMVIFNSTVSHGKRYYKQMALEVAVRTPERYMLLMQIFNKFDGILLDDNGILKIYTQLYIDGFLTTNDCDFSNMSELEIKDYIIKNNKHNNEWGFPTGYQAAFTRYLKTLSEFGFIYAQYKQTFLISEIGKALINDRLSLSEAFAIQSFRFWRKSPYRRVLNDFNYFKFLYKILLKLKEKRKKLSYVQFLISLFSDSGDVDEFIKLIENNKIGNDYDKAYKLVCDKYSKIDSEHSKVSKQSTCFNDYGDTVFRVLQLTGFITIDHSGIILLSLNTNRLDLLNELMSQDFSLTENEKDNEFSYFKKIGSYSNLLQEILNKYKGKEDYSTAEYNKKIPNLLKNYNLDKEILGNYLRDVAFEKKDNRIFKFMQAPLKFEFLITLFVYCCYGEAFKYKPNFKCDDSGIPYSHAPGNIGDIEIYNSRCYWLIEATLIKNKTQQLNNETINLIRHINENAKGEKYLELVAPFIHDDTKLMLRTANLVSLVEYSDMKFYSKASSVDEFISNALNNKNLDSIKKYSDFTFSEVKKVIDDYLDKDNQNDVKK